MKAYASGGVAKEPTVGIFGEAGQEAFVPLAGGRIPVQLRGGRSNYFAFHITAMDGKDVKRMLVEQRELLTSIWVSEAQRQKDVHNTLRQTR